MYKQSFGTQKQLSFIDEHEFYRFLGYLAKSSGQTELVWEHNEKQGAWGSEGRIQIYTTSFQTIWPTIPTTAGNGGQVLSRINCNEFIQELNTNHSFVLGKIQNSAAIRATIPAPYLADFDNGLAIK